MDCRLYRESSARSQQQPNWVRQEAIEVIEVTQCFVGTLHTRHSSELSSPMAIAQVSSALNAPVPVPTPILYIFRRRVEGMHDIVDI